MKTARINSIAGLIFTAEITLKGTLKGSP